MHHELPAQAMQDAIAETLPIQIAPSTPDSAISVTPALVCLPGLAAGIGAFCWRCSTTKRWLHMVPGRCARTRHSDL